MSSMLEGRWQPLRAEYRGQSAPDEVLEKTELELSAGRYTVRFGGETADHGTCTLDPAAQGVLTLFGLEGSNASRTIPCLYQLVGDRLRICYGMDGSRPAAFATAPDSPFYLVTYRRKTP